MEIRRASLFDWIAEAPDCFHRALPIWLDVRAVFTDFSVQMVRALTAPLGVLLLTGVSLGGGLHALVYHQASVPAPAPRTPDAALVHRCAFHPGHADRPLASRDRAPRTAESGELHARRWSECPLCDSEQFVPVYAADKPASSAIPVRARAELAPPETSEVGTDCERRSRAPPFPGLLV